MSTKLNTAEDPAYEPKRQCCGYTLAILGCIGSLMSVIIGPIDPLKMKINCISSIVPEEEHEELGLKSLMFYEPDIWDQISFRLGALLVTVFFILALHYPNYVGGNPKLVKFAPYALGFTLSQVFSIRHVIYILHLHDDGFLSSMASLLFYYVLQLAIVYFMYMRDDSNPEACLICLKPWVYRLKAPSFEYPSYGAPMGYPPNVSNPYQGYPPVGNQAHKGYPAPAYAPQAHGQAPQGYPPQGAPQNQQKV